MRRIWIALAAICCLNAVLLSGCPISPALDGNRPDNHDGGNGSGGNGGMM